MRPSNFNPILFAALGLLLILCRAHASGPEELASLRKSWFDSVDRATKPIDEIYHRELQKLFSQLTRDGKLEEAVAVKSEAESVTTDPYLAVESKPAPEGELPPQLSTLRQSWLASRSRVIEPKNKTYLRDLERLQDKYTRSERLEDALAVKEEIELLKGGRAIAAAAAAGKATFVERFWRTNNGSTFVFRADGSGTQSNASGREWPTRWTMNLDGLVTVDGWADDQKATWYFRFTDEKTGAFGSKSENLSNPVTAP
jgi:hypothetical protein